MQPQLHKVDVGLQVWNRGLGTIELFGTPITVEGVPMVKLAHGAIVAAKGWHANKADAQAEAADRIKEIGMQLLEQAASLRASAAANRQEVSL